MAGMVNTNIWMDDIWRQVMTGVLNVSVYFYFMIILLWARFRFFVCMEVRGFGQNLATLPTASYTNGTSNQLLDSMLDSHMVLTLYCLLNGTNQV